MYYPPGAFVYLAALAKEQLTIPVFCIGRINDPVMAEQILENRQADMIGMTRANICDPELPNKAREGRLDEIRHCIACNEGCWGHVEKLQPITCALNPAVGREEYWGDIPQSASPRRVAVVGGGPAGCEAARVAATAGHSVTLFEASEGLGGQANVASRAPGRTDFAEIGRYFSVELKRLGVDLRLGRTAAASDVLALNPDLVVVATGGTPRVPDNLPGVDGPNVVQAWDVLNGDAAVGQSVVILDDENHVQGLNVAELLASQGKDVELVTREFEVAAHAEPNTRMATLRRVAALGVKVSPTMWAREIQPGSITLAHFYGANEETRPVDTVVLACNVSPSCKLGTELKEKHPDVRLIGDCNGPRRLETAIFEGHLAARSLDGIIPPPNILYAMPLRR
jgi:NADPH-dependent 2,4-dienoyl-CoA reductase/sulfur reductase-like enzyme